MMVLKHKLFATFLIIALVAVFVAGVSSTLAQGTTPTTPPTGHDWDGGLGMMSEGYGQGMMGMMSGNQLGMHSMHDEMWSAIAEALGIDTDTLTTELQSGKSIVQLAEERSVGIQTVYDAALTVMSDNLKAAVEAGFLTQEQADTRLSFMRENISQMPMFGTAGTDGFGFGPMHDGETQMPHMDDDWMSHMNGMWGNHSSPMHGNGMGMMGRNNGMMNH